MCELLGVSVSPAARLGVYFNEFRPRAEDNREGWGIAWWEDGVAHLLKEPIRADESELAGRLAERPAGRARPFIVHVRAATVGRLSLQNTHPFAGQAAGRRWVFAHNGTVKDLDRLDVGVFHPQGETDSERAFHHLLTRLERLGSDPGEDAIADAVLALGRELSERESKVNFLLSDGRTLFAYHDGHKTLHFVEHRAEDARRDGMSDADYRLSLRLGDSPDERAVIVASVPADGRARLDEARPRRLPGDPRRPVSMSPPVAARRLASARKTQRGNAETRPAILQPDAPKGSVRWAVDRSPLPLARDRTRSRVSAASVESSSLPLGSRSAIRPGWFRRRPRCGRSSSADSSAARCARHVPRCGEQANAGGDLDSCRRSRRPDPADGPTMADVHLVLPDPRQGVQSSRRVRGGRAGSTWRRRVREAAELVLVHPRRRHSAVRRPRRPLGELDGKPASDLTLAHSADGVRLAADPGIHQDRRPTVRSGARGHGPPARLRRPERAPGTAAMGPSRNAGEPILDRPAWLITSPATTGARPPDPTRTLRVARYVPPGVCSTTRPAGEARVSRPRTRRLDPPRAAARSGAGGLVLRAPGDGASPVRGVQQRRCYRIRTRVPSVVDKPPKWSLVHVPAGPRRRHRPGRRRRGERIRHRPHSGAPSRVGGSAAPTPVSSRTNGVRERTRKAWSGTASGRRPG